MAILAIVAFALGIGVTTVVFSIFSSVLLAPLPFPDPQELVMVYGTQPACATCPASFPKYNDWKTRNHATFGNGLVIAEIAVAFALLVGAGLMVKNLRLLERRDAGITIDHVIAFDVSPSGPAIAIARPSAPSIARSTSASRRWAACSPSG